MIRIGIDAMGGDFAPNNVILGAIEAYSYISADTKIFLIGDEKKITEVCQHYGIDSGNFVIVHAPESIEMGEHPVRAFRKKKKSSLVVGFNMLAEGKIDVLPPVNVTKLFELPVDFPPSVKALADIRLSYGETNRHLIPKPLLRFAPD